MGIEDLPTFMSDAWGLPIYACQAILAAVVILALVLPIIIIGRDGGKTVNFLSFIMVIFGLFINVSIGWLDPGIFLVLLLCVAAVFALLFGKLLGGE